MSNLNTPFLNAQYYELFQREPYQAPRMTSQEALDEVTWIVFGLVVGIPILAIIPNRHPPHEPMGLGFAAVLGLLFGGYSLYSIWKTWYYGPSDYRLVGEFEVREKDHLFSRCWVRLVPGDNFLVRVEQQLYERLRVGSQLRLTYTAEGEQVSVVLLP